jgi:hypothetical protein
MRWMTRPGVTATPERIAAAAVDDERDDSRGGEDRRQHVAACHLLHGVGQRPVWRSAAVRPRNAAPTCFGDVC